MSNLVSKCGIDCVTCPWGPYPRKDMTAEEFQKFRNDAKRIVGYMPIKTPCVTCQTPDEEIPKKSMLPNKKCLIRQCVVRSGVANCAYCSRFPCDTLKTTAGLWNRERIEEKLGSPISEEKYHSFVEPFEGISRLEAIRVSLDSDDIVEPAKAPTSRTRIADFPEHLTSKEGGESFQSVYKLLANLVSSSLGLQDIDTFAQYHKLENQKTHIFRFLWICGKYGNTEGPNLVVDAATYLANRGKEKTLSIWSFVKEVVFKVLAEFGVDCERVGLEGTKDEDLTTGTGYLRKRGWVMRISFEKEIGGTAALRALQTYAKELDKKYGPRVFQHFRNADMTSLLETYNVS